MKRPLKILLFILIFIVLSMGSGFYYVARNLNDSLDPDIESPSSTDELMNMRSTEYISSGTRCWNYWC
jgi:hypothetical protein